MQSIVNRAVYIPFESNRSSNRDLIRGKKIQIAIKAGYHRPAIECWFGSFVICQGIRTSIAKKPYVFVIFRGGGGPDPLSPLWNRT